MEITDTLENSLQNSLNRCSDIMKKTVQVGTKMSLLLDEYSHQLHLIEESLEEPGLLGINFYKELYKDNDYIYAISIERNFENPDSRMRRIYGITTSICDPEQIEKRPLRQMKVERRLNYIKLLPDFLEAYNAHVEEYVNNFINSYK